MVIKVVAIGDESVGKTCLFLSYTTKKFPVECFPTVFDNYTADISVDGKLVQLSLWDTAGSCDYDKLRPLTYPATDIFLVCFAINQPKTFENVQKKWLPELDRHYPNAAKLLIGCKNDVRSSNPDNCISRSDIEDMARKLKLIYCETSALESDGVDECFEKVVRTARRQC